MTDQERLARLKRRAGITDSSKDELLTDILADMICWVKLYTQLTALPEALEGTLTELGIMAYNRLGLEGQSTGNAGGISVSIDTLPAALRAALDRARIGRVV